MRGIMPSLHSSRDGVSHVATPEATSGFVIIGPMRRSTVTITMVLSASILVWAGGLMFAQEATRPTPTQEQAGILEVERTTHESVCSSCHEASVVTGAFRMPEEWDEALARMQSFGLDATPEQLNQVRSFLLRNYGKARVNSAPATDLAPVLDVPPAVAEVVVTIRRDNGPFKTLDDLKAIPGLDPAKVDARKARLMF